jgi:arabinosaccharide transport system substrate-binding protein
MAFHLGKPILVMLIVAVFTGVATLLRHDLPAKQLTFWVSADSHFTSYQSEIAGFEKKTGISVDLEIVQAHALSHRLQADFADQLIGAGVPDVVEVEISQVGKFFRPPLSEVGFLPIRPMLEGAGWYDQIDPVRYAPWSKDGVLFGVPHDIHPVGITYREDLFREARIDLSTAKTWPQFEADCRGFQIYWQSRGYRTRHAMEIYSARIDLLVIMLLQRGINLIDDHNQIHLADPKVAQTLAFYAKCAAGPARIGSESGEGDGPLARDLLEGNLCAFVTPDWRIGLFKQYGGPALSGKLRFMPLPRFDAADAPTATWGGTMIAILKSSPHQAEAWKLIERLYFDPEGIDARRRSTQILPPVKSMWDRPSYHQPDPYFGGQMLDEELIALARQIPPRFVTPATNIAGIYLMQALHNATTYVEDNGDAGLEAACQQWLTTAAADLHARMRQWEFDETAATDIVTKVAR